MTINVANPAMIGNDITNIMVIPRQFMHEQHPKLHGVAANVLWTSPDVLASNSNSLVKVTVSYTLLQQQEAGPWRTIVFSNGEDNQSYSSIPTDINLMDYIKSVIQEKEVNFNLHQTVHQLAFDEIIRHLKLTAPDLPESEVVVVCMGSPSVQYSHNSLISFTLKGESNEKRRYSVYSDVSECTVTEEGVEKWKPVTDVVVGDTLRVFNDDGHVDWTVDSLNVDESLCNSVNVNVLFNLHPKVTVSPLVDGVSGQWMTIREVSDASMESKVTATTVLGLLHVIDNEHHLKRTGKGVGV